MNNEGMFFLNDEHHFEYEILLGVYDLRPRQNPQYEASIYIAAVPEIAKLIDLKTLRTDIAPIYHLTRWDDKEEKHIANHPGLTGTTMRLLYFGLSLYNGHRVDMDDILGTINTDMFPVLVQAMKIRKRI